MKLLLDQNLSFKLCLRLQDLFPDSDQARLLGMAEAAETLLRRHFVAIKDFTEEEEAVCLEIY